MTREPVEVCYRPWVGKVAEHIPDDLMRLRFLKAVAPEVDAPAEAAPPFVRTRHSRTLRFLLPALVMIPALSFVLLRATPDVRPTPVSSARKLPSPPPAASAAPPPVWQVEQGQDADSFSNGLRIDNRFAVSNHPRSYRTLSLDPDGTGAHGSTPVGIVFHTTESRQAPFEEQQNRVLQRIGQSMLEYVRQERAYNFVIDRFGRVYRIVVEGDAANHAGHSVWSDAKWIYLNLNESFLGISVEAGTEAGQLEPKMSDAQVRAAAILTEMLRSRYGISADNCVTHAQVSVNPSNMRVGYHTDWASSFPFAHVGLPDNYARALPALILFGFQADPSFDRVAGARMAAAADLSEQQLRDQAAAADLPLGAYRKSLQKRYRDLEAIVHSTSERAASE